MDKKCNELKGRLEEWKDAWGDALGAYKKFDVDYSHALFKYDELQEKYDEFQKDFKNNKCNNSN